MNEVKLFALSTCVHCKNTKAFLDQCGVKYECVFVDQLSGPKRQEAIAEVRKHNPAVSFPTVVIGETVVVGFDKKKLEKALGR
ncbi:MAG: glutaredoxin family protein [Desulfovibrionaceae bacterium]|nr:glutaredoxin family protein [Desulfovibrionaceae bacterium]MDD4952293.1 glutaredoxin family protein [Desulfovibrionaceae bacterium]